MNFIIPPNIFAAVFAFNIPEAVKENIKIESSSLLSTKLEEDKNSIGLIPSCDLIKHKDFFISKSIAISFDGNLSNSFLYFIPRQQNFEDIFLKGDISLNEIIITKILFSEKYDTEVNITLDTQDFDFGHRNYLVAGNENFEMGKFEEGVSFSDEIADLLNYPYVHYLVASKSSEILESFSKEMMGLDKIIEDSLSQILNSLNIKAEHRKYFKDNFNSIYFDMTDNELVGLNELLRLPFYHGIVEEINEIKFV